ncbi:MAG: hypothetical protein K0U60_04470 [Actinomycetia bacterium]|nr:hypothetical protein [Actinomycetes bacterium]MCH9800205.1 hypothetical protein [Actinomycetes bacterium]
MATSAVPPGWPRDLPAPDSAEFRERVVAWLLDRAPAGFRTARTLRSQPQALALIVANVAMGEVEALRVAYAGARRELIEYLGPDEIAAVLADIEAQGAQSAESLRQVELVAAALAGQQWRARL